jgi:L-fuculose-phosphate aldolase
MKDDSSKLSRFVRACHRLETEGLIRCSSGNMSCRLPEDRFMISMSRVWLGQITDEEVAVLRISDGAHLSGPKPSTEWRIHQGILQQRNDVSVVLHWHSAYATIMACRNTMNVNYNVIPEIPYYIGPIGSVAY